MNSKSPAAAIEKIRRLALDADSFAYFSIDAQGQLLDQGGELTSLDLPDWSLGDNLLDKALFLHGYLPLARAFESIVCYQLSDSCVVDIYLFRDGEGTLILLLDRSQASAAEAELRQQRNEARLRARYGRG